MVACVAHILQMMADYFHGMNGLLLAIPVKSIIAGVSLNHTSKGWQSMQRTIFHQALQHLMALEQFGLCEALLFGVVPQYISEERQMIRFSLWLVWSVYKITCVFVISAAILFALFIIFTRYTNYWP